MAKSKNHLPVCSSCKQGISRTQMKRTLALLPFDGIFLAHEGDSREDSLYRTLVSNPLGIRWACDACLEAGNALIGRPRKQRYTFNPMDVNAPYLAYTDRHLPCDRCGEKFVFRKEEQRYWYEELNFVVMSYPKQCAPCRRTLREGRSLNTELSQLLADGEPQSVSDLRRVIEIYTLMEKPERVAYYTSRLPRN
ncbi:zinc-ribbon domain containing protein [Lewinella sp. W8]|uniref:zinc-ribbon domain containing protein n=1 Tax=Lewinella sp. W8 TaxID=2528208 RepID=UPI001067C9D0|nr:zinc-ribbon domain containing protein [Lewinella sp. W8]MTB49473.1 hypothetical protein [Lewinella sp. W8]